MKVYIDSSCDIQYASFYIRGLYVVYGRKNVKFSNQHFKQFKHNNHFFAFIVKDKSSLKKVIIDFTDSNAIDAEALKWSDVYGKINLDDSLPQDPKIIPIGPSFGIRLFSLFETLSYAFINLCKAYTQIPNKRRFLSDYKAQYKRPKLSDYRHQNPIANYVFFMTSLWKQEPLANSYRANFIKSCKTSPNLTFEGGFAPRTKNDIQGFEDLTVRSRIKMQDYLNKTIDSLVAFNTPAVKKCHGWKLAEYLCLGKAILATPLSRQMPQELENNKHLLYTDGSELDITKKLNAIVMDPELRKKLELNATAYFNKYLAPKQVILRLMTS